MMFNWKPYTDNDASIIDSWLDDEAIAATGLDDGWQCFHDYWMAKNLKDMGQDRCYLIIQDKIPFAVMYLAISGAEIVISELIVAPNMRGKNLGTRVIKELLDNACQLLNTDAALVSAIIFPGNTASVKAFEKAGFSFVRRNHDDLGDSLKYAYNLSATE